MMKTKRNLLYYIAVFILSIFVLTGCSDYSETVKTEEKVIITSEAIVESKSASEEELSDSSITEENATIETISDRMVYSLSEIPPYSGKPYIEINQNIPYFTEDELTTEPFENYSKLDSLGRCGVAYANICEELMPTEKRGEIGMIRPSGWHTVKYEGIEGNYLFNRCHLIAFQLAGENANDANLITGTRSMNTEMIPFENKIADYVKETGHHVLYRVTPVYEGDNLLANGVLMEAKSVEDDEICFNVFLYNVQDGISLNYATGESLKVEDSITKELSQNSEEDTAGESASENASENNTTYILNTNTMKFHYPTCSSADTIKEHNKEEYFGSREDLIKNGYEPCKRCNP